MTHVTDDYKEIFKTVLQLRVLSTTLKKSSFVLSMCFSCSLAFCHFFQGQASMQMYW